MKSIQTPYIEWPPPHIYLHRAQLIFFESNENLNLERISFFNSLFSGIKIRANSVDLEIDFDTNVPDLSDNIFLDPLK
jgi:hypothetical protein